MSRGLQMLVEERSIPHALMLCGPSGAETAHGFHRKTVKTAFRTPTMNRKQQFLRFVPLRRAENGNFCVSYPYDEQKTAKTAFRTPTMSRKRRKPRFVPLR